MSGVLGILAATDENFDHLVGLTRAAAGQDKTVVIFFSGRGVLLTRKAGFDQLAGLAEMSLCKVSFDKHELDPEEPVPGIPPENFVSQSRHADLIERADRYVVL